MENPSVPEVTQPKPESPRLTEGQVSPDIWKDLLHTSIVGNAMFPQSFFAQGVLLADRMTNLANERKATIDSLLKENPTTELIFDMMEKAKIKSHSAYGFKTSPSMMGGSVINIWGSDKNHARDTLTSFAEVIHEPDSYIPEQNLKSQTTKLQTLHKVFSNPQELSIMQEMLGIARQSLLSPETKVVSNNYKRKIGEFMVKYSKYDFSRIPEGYNEEQAMLRETLYTMLKEVTSSMKSDLVSHTEESHLQNSALLERLKNFDTERLFGSVGVHNIRPLRNPDYE